MKKAMMSWGELIQLTGVLMCLIGYILLGLVSVSWGVTNLPTFILYCVVAALAWSGFVCAILRR